MSIEKEYGMHVPVCDICQEERLESVHDFYDAVASKKAAGWKSKNIKGE